jgi:hypothetical protein
MSLLPCWFFCVTGKLYIQYIYNNFKRLLTKKQWILEKTLIIYRNRIFRFGTSFVLWTLLFGRWPQRPFLRGCVTISDAISIHLNYACIIMIYKHIYKYIYIYTHIKNRSFFYIQYCICIYIYTILPDCLVFFYCKPLGLYIYNTHCLTGVLTTLFNLCIYTYI